MGRQQATTAPPSPAPAPSASLALALPETPLTPQTADQLPSTVADADAETASDRPRLPSGGPVDSSRFGLAQPQPPVVPSDRGGMVTDSRGRTRDIRRGPANNPEASLGALAEVSENERILRLAGETYWFAWGNPEAPPLYMVADPNCPYCHEALRSLLADVAGGRVDLRVIMVGALDRRTNGMSSALSASIIDARDSLAAFGRYNGTMGAQPGAFTNQAFSHVGVNTRFIQANGLSGTPYFIFRNGSTGEATRVRGLPADLLGCVLAPLVAEPGQPPLKECQRPN